MSPKALGPKGHSTIPLYMGKSIDDLNRLVSAEVYHIKDKDQLKKCIKKNEKDTQETAEKALKKGDEERAYVFYRLYLDQLDDLWSSPVAKSLPNDELKKLRNMTSPIRREQAEMACSRLKGSLEKRYTDLALIQGRGLEDLKLHSDSSKFSFSEVDSDAKMRTSTPEQSIEHLAERVRRLRADAQEEIEKYLDKREKLLQVQISQLKEEAHHEITQYLNKREFALLNEIGMLRESINSDNGAVPNSGPTAPGWVE